MSSQLSATRDVEMSIEPYIFDRVPDYQRAVLVGVKVGDGDRDAIDAGLVEASGRWATGGAEAVAVPSVQRWRQAYRRVRLNPTRTRPAVEALIRRAGSGGMRSFGNAYVDVGALVTLLHCVPVGMHALDDVPGTLTLARASGAETFMPFVGEVQHPDPSEIVWRSGELILTRHWVHKQGVVGAVTDASSLFAVNLDFLGGDDVQDALDTAIGWLDVAGIEVMVTVMLDRESPCGHIAVSAAGVRSSEPTVVQQLK